MTVEAEADILRLHAGISRQQFFLCFVAIAVTIARTKLLCFVGLRFIVLLEEFPQLLKRLQPTMQDWKLATGNSGQPLDIFFLTVHL